MGTRTTDLTAADIYACSLISSPICCFHLTAIIPSLPLPTTSALTDDEDDRLVRIAIQRWFQRVCEDPALIGRGNIQRQGQGQEQGQGQGHGGEDEVRSFVESDFGVSGGE